ncbi:MAG: phage terminase large subunit [Marinomonas sp.]
MEPQLLAQAGMLESSVYGVVDRVDNIDGELVPNIIRKWKGTIGNMEPTKEEPTILLIEKLEPAILKHKKYKCFFGGRGGTKSRFAQDVTAGEVNGQGSKVYVLRERMKSLKESIFAGIEKSIKDLKFSGFRSLPTYWEIRHKTGGKFTFGGMQNIIDMKGASNYKIFLMEEAAKTKQQTIDTLGPTLRDTPNAELWYLWNCESSQDAMSKEFILPYQADIDRQGYYEDDYHLVIKVGYQDNPWFVHDESLNQELEKDKQKRDDGRMSRSRFNHIWEGAFNDDVDNSVIISDWFDACIDAHVKLGIDESGSKVVGFDPSDTGNDPAGYVARRGITIKHVTEIEAENGNRKFDAAALMARKYGCDSFGWDGDGLGAILRDQADKHFDGTNVNYFMYKGSSSPHNPESTFSSDNSNITIDQGRLVKDVFSNKKAQNITNIAERIYKTYEAVIHRKYHNPEDLISFDSSTIKPEMLAKLKAEACKMPLKPSDKIRFYTKEELRKGIMLPDGSRLKIPSPNLFDALGISFDESATISSYEFQTITHEPVGIV